MLIRDKTALSAFLESLSGFHPIWAFYWFCFLWAIWAVMGPLWWLPLWHHGALHPAYATDRFFCHLWFLQLPFQTLGSLSWNAKNRSMSQKAPERNRDSTCPLAHLLESSLSAATLCSKKQDIGLGSFWHGYCSPFVAFPHVHRSFAWQG